MASVRELKTVWQIRFCDSKRTPKRTTNSLPKSEYTRKEAESEAEWREQLYRRGQFDPWTQDAPGAFAPDERLTVLEAAELYRDEKKRAGEAGEQGGWSPSSVKSRGYVCTKFAEKVGPHRLVESITTKDVRDFVRDPELAHETQRGYLRIVRAMARWWHERGLRPPLEMPVQLKRKREPYQVIDEDELEAICAAHYTLCEERRQKKKASADPKHTGTEWMCDVWRFAFWQGLRRGACMELRPEDINLKYNQIQVGNRYRRAKGDKIYVAPLIPEAREILERWMEDKRPGERVFGHASHQYVSDDFRAAVKRAIKDGDIPPKEKLNFHSLRHSCAARILRETGNIYLVTQLLGHASVKITRDHYEHFIPSELQNRFEVTSANK